MSIEKVRDDLYKLSMKLPGIEGFDGFMVAWLYRGDHTLLVDVGPLAVVPELVEELGALGVSSIDAVLLTHIHIDHAGGVGKFLHSFPGTPVVVHDEGMRHLIDPSRLWEGSRKTLGGMADIYGPIGAVPEELLKGASNFNEFGVTPVPTPGHAPHHVSYRVKDLLFAGEVAGVYRSLPGGGYILRPATPPRFFLETSLESIDRVRGGGESLILFAHGGMTDRVQEILEAGREQLLRWRDLIAGVMAEEGREDFISLVTDLLLEKDPLLGEYMRLSTEDRSRERIFMVNSILGFVGYLKEKGRDG